MGSRHMIAAGFRPAGPMRWLRRVGFGLCAGFAGYCALAPMAVLDAAEKVKLKPSSELASSAAADTGSADTQPTFGIGDPVSMQVYGRPELNTTTFVADDGTIAVPLAGSVPVVGLSPANAAKRVAAAFREGKFLVDPQVTIFRSQHVSVLGAVRTPGRFVVESRATVLDVLAQAGGVNENGANVVVLLRPENDGKVSRQSIDLKGLSQQNAPLPTLTLRGGDSIFVPPADQFSIYGEVKSPNLYRLESGMTVVQAIARGGGITPRGSSSRIEISRNRPDGTTVIRDGKLNDAVQANDVIRVKERFF